MDKTAQAHTHARTHARLPPLVLTHTPKESQRLCTLTRTDIKVSSALKPQRCLIALLPLRWLEDVMYSSHGFFMEDCQLSSRMQYQGCSLTNLRRGCVRRDKQLIITERKASWENWAGAGALDEAIRWRWVNLDTSVMAMPTAALAHTWGWWLRERYVCIPRCSPHGSFCGYPL